MRKLKRLVAKNNMKKAGMSRICKKNGGRSWFAQHWREWIWGGERNVH